MTAGAYLSADEASQLLGVKRATLYAYVSRGLVRSVPDPESARGRLYHRSDLDRLRTRSRARAASGPVAASAMRWGDPVLDTAICAVSAAGPSYRGHALGELLGQSFEDVVALLWQTDQPLSVPDCVNSPPPAASIDGLRLALLQAELADETRQAQGDAAVLRQGASILAALAGGETGSIAERVAARLQERNPEQPAIALVERSLIVCAEHELNASAFAARVAASTGANLYACVSAALAAFSGPAHGGAGHAVARLLDEAQRRGARQTLLDRLSSGEALPGFGQRLYPQGDPRFQMLWELARATAPQPLDSMQAVRTAAEELGLGHPNLDFGLAAVVRACGFGPNTASLLFAIGRSAGWIAHAREQRTQGFMLRPRARYTGDS